MPPDTPLPRPVLVLLVIAVAALWFAGLETRTLLHPDEGRYAEIPREMVATGNWITPRLNGLKYFEKPPLQYWTTALAYESFGVHPWTARLWTAGSTLFAALFLGYAGWRLGGATLGTYAAAVLAGCFGYIFNAHLLTLDGGLCAFLVVAFGAFLIAQRAEATSRETRGWMWVAWAAMAGAALSKGLIGIVIPAASLALYTLATRDFRLWRRLHLVSGALLFLILTAPWFVAVSRANPEFLDFFFIHEHFTRYTTIAHGRSEPWWYFIPLLLVGMLPWTGLLAWAAPRLWRDSAPAANGFSWQRFALIWSAFVFFFFSASGSKLPSYILPMYPPLCLVAAWLLRDIAPRSLARHTLPGAVLVVLATVAVAFAYEPVARRLVAETASLAPALRFAPWVTAALAIVAIGTVAAYAGLRLSASHGRTIAVLALALSMLAAVQVGMIGYDSFRATRSSRDLLREAEAAHGPFAADVPFYHVHMHDQTVPFYLRRTTTFVSFRDEFALGQDAEPDRAIATDVQWVPIWERLQRAYAMMPPNDYERFAAAGVPMRVLARDARRVIVSRQ
jgi:4-amino-4-deoxy-L-arabinose transferase-like glycosyltransferase